MKPESFLRSLASTAFWKGLETLSGIGKHIIIAGAIGLSAGLDVYYMAIGFLGVAVYSWGALFEALAVPRLIKLWNSGDKARFHQLAGGMMTLAFLLGGILVLGLVMGRVPLSQLAVGFGPERKAMLAESFLWLIPVIALYVPFRFLGGIFRATRRFSVFNQAEFLLALMMLALVAAFPHQPHVLLWSFSGAIALAILYLILRAAGWVRLVGRPFSPEVLDCLKAAPSLFLIQVVDGGYQLLQRFFGSFLPERALGALNYGSVIASLLPALLVFGNSFITVFAERRAAGETGEEVVNDLLSLTILAGVPACFFLVAFGDGMVSLLLERGVFDASATALTSQALMGAIPGVLATMLLAPIGQIFQVLGRNHVLLARTAVGLLLSAGLNGLFLFHLQSGVLGVALASSLSQLAMLVAALGFLDKEGIPILWGRHLRWAGYMGAAGLLAIWAEQALNGLPSPLWLMLGLKASIFVGICAGLALAAPGPEGQLTRRTLLRVLPAASSLRTP